MFYFILKFLFYLILIFSTLYIFKLKEITILEIIILIIILNIDLYSLYTNLNIIYTFLLFVSTGFQIKIKKYINFFYLTL